MKFIRKVTMLDAMLDSSNVAEADATEWLPATAFTVGQTCMVTTTANGASIASHKIYTAQGSTTGDDPTVDDGTNWVETSSTNRWKMFDSVVQDQTVNAGGIDVEITPGAYTTELAFINIDAASIDVIMNDPTDGEVFNETVSLVSDSGINNWYMYYFEPIVRVNDYILTGLPAYSTATLTININDAGTAKLGALVMGTFFEIGQSLEGAAFSITDYSQKTVDANGRATITQGPFAKIGRVDVVIDTARAPSINTALADYRSTPTVWAADEDNAATIIFGYFQNFETILSSHPTSYMNLQIQGLI